MEYVYNTIYVMNELSKKINPLIEICFRERIPHKIYKNKITNIYV